MNTEALVDYLARNGFGVKGKTLFGVAMPGRVHEGILVLNNTPITRHPYQKGRRDGHFQVVVRGTEFTSIQSKARAIAELLDTEGLQIGDMKFLSVRPVAEPFIYPRTDGNLLEASVNFNFVYVI